MEPQTREPVGARSAAAAKPAAPAAAAPADLLARFPGKYLSLTSYKRDGTAVATPVWFVIDDGRLLVKTDGRSGKAKRIRRDPSVMVASCNPGGRMRSDPVPARAELLPAGEMKRVDELMARKYRIDRILILPVYRLVQRLRGAGSGNDEVALAITPS